MEKYIKLIEDAKKFWGDVLSKNGKELGDLGVTVWVDESKNQVDSLYNPEDNPNSWIVDYDTEEPLFAFDKNGMQLNIDKNSLKDEATERDAFNDWLGDGNVTLLDGCYATQDAQWRNRIPATMFRLYRYFLKEIYNK